MSEIDVAAAVGLAVTAAGTAPTDPMERARWLSDVRSLTVDLYRMAEAVRPDLEVLAQVQPVTGIIRRVSEQSGRAVISFEPTMGNKEPGELEDLRTPWLNTPQGAQLADLARSLIGHHCAMGKWYDDMGGGRKVRMCAWIEPTGQPAQAPAGRPTQERVVGSPPADSAPQTNDRRPADGAHGNVPERGMDEPSLFAFTPASSAELTVWAREALDMPEERVREIAGETLRPLEPGTRRSRDELRHLWRECVRRSAAEAPF